MNTIRILFLSLFFILGIGSGYLTYQFKDNRVYGSDLLGERNYGVDSANDGVAVGLGFISGCSFICGTLILISLNKRQNS